MFCYKTYQTLIQTFIQNHRKTYKQIIKHIKNLGVQWSGLGEHSMSLRDGGPPRCGSLQDAGSGGGAADGTVQGTRACQHGVSYIRPKNGI